MFSRLIDNSVVVLENIFRHLEEGESPEVAAEKGGQEVAPAGAGGDVHHGHRILPGCVSLWRQPVPVHRIGRGGGVLAFRVLHGRDDGGAAVLRALHQGPRLALRIMARKTAFARFVNGFNRRYDQMLMHYDIAVGKTLLRPAARCWASSGIFCLQPRALPAAGRFVFPAHGSRAIHDQPEGADRNAPGADRSVCSAGWRRISAKWFRRAT